MWSQTHIFLLVLTAEGSQQKFQIFSGVKTLLSLRTTTEDSPTLVGMTTKISLSRETFQPLSLTLLKENAAQYIYVCVGGGICKWHFFNCVMDTHVIIFLHCESLKLLYCRKYLQCVILPGNCTVWKWTGCIHHDYRSQSLLDSIKTRLGLMYSYTHSIKE